jgi:PAS domain-containing protein
MRRMTPLMWISLGLVGLTVGVMLAGDWLVGLAPNHDRQTFEYRRDLAESLAVQYSTLTEHAQVETVKVAMEAVTKRNPDILSLALLQADGTMVAQIGDHARTWVQPLGQESTREFLQVPIFNGNQRWGVLQIAFIPTAVSKAERLLADPWIRFLAFVSVIGFAGYFLFMKRVVHQLDPSNLLPDRVKATLDALMQGVVVIDRQDRIVLANAPFSQAVGQPMTSLVGSDLGSLSWMAAEASDELIHYPWTDAITDQQPQEGTPLLLDLGEGAQKKFLVTAVPIMDRAATVGGAVVSLHDVTELERAGWQLREAKSEVESYRTKLLEKDRELQKVNMSLQAALSERQKVEEERAKLHQQLRQVTNQAGVGKGEAAA